MSKIVVYIFQGGSFLNVPSALTVYKLETIAMIVIPDTYFKLLLVVGKVYWSPQVDKRGRSINNYGLVDRRF